MPPLAISYSGLLGGAERVLLEAAAGLTEPPVLACPEGPLAEAARRSGLAVFELSKGSLELRRGLGYRLGAPLHIGVQAAELRALCAELSPSVLIAWGMRAALVVGAAFARGHHPPLVFQHNDLLPGPLIARAVRLVASRAELVVAASDCVARDLDPTAELGSRLAVVRPGVDLERFRPDQRDDGNALEVLVLGAIEPWKQPELALVAGALAARELPELRLRLVGAPLGAAGRELLERLRARARLPDLDGRVVLESPAERPERLLARASCLLHCAEREPYGLVVAEAMASGVPVVAPDSCGPAEIVRPGGGRLYPPGDAAAAGSALIDLFRDPAERARLGKAARAEAERRLDVRAMRARYAGLLDGVTRDSGRAGRSGAPGEGLAVVTVLHDSERELARLLDSLDAHLPAAQVVIVDSGSSDGGADLARSWRDAAAEVLVLGENTGFGRAVNAGLALVREPVTALLNPDVELPDASLAALAGEAARPPERLLVPIVLRPDGSREDNAQREPGSPALLVHALVPGAALPRPLAGAVEPWRSRKPSRVGWAVGSCVLARTDTLRRLGPFDERAFMYAEDLDLGLRAADAGIETVFWPGARVVHAGAHSTRRFYGGEPFELLARRRRQVVRERRGRLRSAADDMLQLLTFADRLVLKSLARHDSVRERRQLAALVRARRP